MSEKLMDWAIVATVTVAFLSFPLGATVFHFTVRTSLSEQLKLDAQGLPVAARLVSKQLDRNFHRNIAGRELHQGDLIRKVCYFDIEYSMAGSNETLRKSIQMNDPTICKRYQIGDLLMGRAMPGVPETLRLDENRMGAQWYWISLFAMMFFVGGPLLLILRIAYRRVARPLHNKT